ncbi:HdeD family acid-resistance protein [Acinetobacter qingfengensis]|uniref:Uncharacterized protein n=1 Tax=Acinetobacter qingfengensis TaxID=1262585 RepID=A0A1E7RFJ2_9GAMM|nr:HdeD family acid-resistance protein [Acinetobacter qingfengensis]KAA8732759.1 HdeD family acid-resistance protein [Acinetobacter qingfengensis]OEY98128.1 hypothetical protein BJI46_00985 [Acinetobacter qingfengensis]
MITVSNDLIRKHLHAESKWYVVLGISFILAGIALFLMLPLATLSVVYFFGILMMCAGMLQLIVAFTLLRSDSRWLWALFSIFYFMAGYFAFSSPNKAAIVLTSLMGMFLLFAGAARMAYATFLKEISNWKWAFLSGLLIFIAGVLILLNLTTSFWILGAILAIDVLLQGIYYLTVARLIKSIPPVSTTINKEE